MPESQCFRLKLKIRHLNITRQLSNVMVGTVHINNEDNVYCSIDVPFRIWHCWLFWIIACRMVLKSHTIGSRRRLSWSHLAAPILPPSTGRRRLLALRHLCSWGPWELPMERSKRNCSFSRFLPILQQTYSNAASRSCSLPTSIPETVPALNQIELDKKESESSSSSWNVYWWHQLLFANFSENLFFLPCLSGF